MISFIWADLKIKISIRLNINDNKRKSKLLNNTGEFNIELFSLFFIDYTSFNYI